MLARNPFDAAHLQGAADAARFQEALLSAGRMPEGEARRHGDNAYVFVEYLANSYPKVPAQASERDVWLFLFDYYISQGPFRGHSVEIAPLSTRLFIDFLARSRHMPEAEFIRRACERADLFKERLAEWDAIAREAGEGTSPAEAVDERVAAWQDHLTEEMWPLGLVPDAALARGEGPWEAEMGPLEAAVLEAVCVVLSRRARELSAGGVSGARFDEELVDAQDRFMRTRNPGLGASPLEAVLAERQGPPTGSD